MDRVINKKVFYHLLRLSIASYGWVLCISVMFLCLVNRLGEASYFYEMCFISAATGAGASLYFGKLIDQKSAWYVMRNAFLIQPIAWLVLGYADSYIAFSIGFILLGFGFGALGAATDPYIHDITLTLGCKEDYVRITSRVAKLKMYLLILILPIGGALYELHEPLPFILNSVLGFVALIDILKNKNFSTKHEQLSEVEETNWSGNVLTYLAKDRLDLLALLLAGGIFICLSDYIQFAHQLKFSELGGDSTLFLGVVLAFSSLFKGLGAQMIELKKSNKIVALFLLTLIYTTVASISVTNIVSIMAIYIAASALRSYLEIYFSTQIVESAPYHMKGRVRGLYSSLDDIFALFMMLGLSFHLKEHDSSGVFLIYAGLFITCLVLWLFFAFKQVKTKAEV